MTIDQALALDETASRSALWEARSVLMSALATVQEHLSNERFMHRETAKQLASCRRAFRECGAAWLDDPVEHGVKTGE